jgi:hypothetical protein
MQQHINYNINTSLNLNLFVITQEQSHISNLLMSLFYVQSSSCEYLLNSNIKEYYAIYLQEVIKSDFVNTVRQGKSILNLDLICNISKKLNYNDNNDNIKNNDKNNVLNYYNFLIDKFKEDNLNIILNINIDFNNNIEKNICDLIANNLNKLNLNNLNNLNINNLNINNLKFLPVYLNKIKKNIKINIQKRIKVNNQDMLFSSCICFNELNKTFYSLINVNNKFIIYDNSQVPCLSKLDIINDVEKISNIKQECFFIFYKKI